MTKEQEGRIIRSLSGFYDVQTPDGVVTCRGRGSLRRQGESPLCGDRVLITRQNHQYALKAKSLDAAGLSLTFRSLNDGSVEGIEHSEYSCAGIEFDPDEQFFTAFEKAMEKEGY